MAHFEHWATDAGSVVILGRTQTGKTTTAREIHRETGRVSVFLNSTGDERVPNIAGKEVRGIDAVESGLASGRTKFNWLSRDRELDTVRLKHWYWHKAQLSGRELPLQLVADEAHHVAPQSQKLELAPRDAIRTMFKEGQKRNIKVVLVTQDPVALDKQTLRQREYLLSFPLSAEQSRYMADYGVDADVVNDQPDYSGVLYHASGDVMKQGVRAKQRYA